MIYILLFPIKHFARHIVTKPYLNRFMEGVIPLYWKIGNSNDFLPNQLNKRIFNNFPICIYRDEDETLKAISDICIHRGASLSKGKLIKSNSNNSCVQCPYHGWEFNDGYVKRLPGSERDYNIGVPKFKIHEDSNDVFILPTFDELSQKGNISNIKPKQSIYYPPEHYNHNFVKISGAINVNANHNLITENVLDMMHVSYVHTFGNSLSPLPFKIYYDDIDNLSGRTHFYYTSGLTSMSNILGNAKHVEVENEFHLPDTTVTRVRANENFVKTIVTRCCPINENKSILFYDLYRNFLTLPINDILFHYQMTKTLQEDVTILKDVYTDYQKGYINTQYDITQVKFREKKNLFMKQFAKKKKN